MVHKDQDIDCQEHISPDHQIPSSESDCGWQWESLAVRYGQRRSSEMEHSEALFLTSSYCFHSAAEAAAVFAGEQPGSVYSRYTNPTVQCFQERLAALEGGEACAATASGMAAIFSLCIAHLNPGDHVVVSKNLFGTTVGFFENYLKPKMGVSVSFVALTDLNAWQQACTANTRMFFLESPSNPLNEVVDLTRLSAIAKAHNTLLVVDNCLCTPALQQPLALGADMVVHSATKFLDGQGRCLGGAVVGANALVEPVLGVLRTVGPSMSPFNAWVFLKGLETLGVRMRAQCDSALTLAQWLDAHPKVLRVHYSGLPSHPSHQLASHQQKAFGAVVAFEVAGGRKSAWQVIDGTKMLSITGNLGDTKTTITHPATTTHGRLSDEDKSAAGITEGLIRVAVGLEQIEDICRDLEAGLSLI
jgi:O-succinylhomoserine sulfhydrylase